MLDVNLPLDKEKMELISKKCYSNIFVYDKIRENIVGIVRTK